MSGRGLIALILEIAAAGGLSGCAGPIAVVRESPSAIELRWMNSENSFEEARLWRKTTAPGARGSIASFSIRM